MQLVATLTLLIAALTFALPASAAESPQERAIHARQGHMYIRAFNAAQLFGMVKREIPYDAETASRLANNLKTMLDVDMRAAWVKGTSTDEYPDKTRALPKIWVAGSEFDNREKAYAKAVNEVAGVAGDGLDSLAPAVKNLGKSCKACHDDYREKK